jgi:hypothetical protein
MTRTEQNIRMLLNGLALIPLLIEACVLLWMWENMK